MNTHHQLSPSRFPAWVQCSVFDSDPSEREDATEGTRQHELLASLLRTPKTDSVSQVTDDPVPWAAGYIRTLAGSELILVEHPVSYTAPDGFARSGVSEVFSGTADAVIIRGNLADLIDYKSGSDGDYRAQLAGYALALFSMRRRIKTVRCHVLYGRTRSVDTWSLTQADAAGTVIPILERRRDPALRIPQACSYCGFCLHRRTCPALIEQVSIVARSEPAWEDLAAAIRDPHAITDPVIAGKALTLARMVSTWADAIRAKASELAKAGTVPVGYRLQERRGVREITDIKSVFTKTGLSADQFMTACKVSIPKLTEAYAQFLGMPQAKASSELESILGGLVQEGAPVVALVQDKYK